VNLKTGQNLKLRLKQNIQMIYNQMNFNRNPQQLLPGIFNYGSIFFGGSSILNDNLERLIFGVRTGRIPHRCLTINGVP
jgi:hypothetical protein